MLLQTVCHHYLQDSELEAALATIQEFHLEAQTLTACHDYGRTPPQVDSAGSR